jgi:uncharacterized protein YukE
MSDGMLYNSGALDTLHTDLGSYQKQLTELMNRADGLASGLQANWSGSGQEAFENLHKQKLMPALQTVIDLVGKGMNGVQTAKDNAFTTDTNVAGTFFE